MDRDVSENGSRTESAIFATSQQPKQSMSSVVRPNQSVRFCLGLPNMKDKKPRRDSVVKAQLRFARNRHDVIDSTQSDYEDVSFSENHSTFEEDMNDSFTAMTSMESVETNGSSRRSSAGSLSSSAKRNLALFGKDNVSRRWMRDSEGGTFAEDELFDLFEVDEDETELLETGSTKSLGSKNKPLGRVKPDQQSQPQKGAAVSPKNRIQRTLDAVRKPGNTLTKTTYYMSRIRVWTLEGHGKFCGEVAEAGGVGVIVAVMKQYLQKEAAEEEKELTAEGTKAETEAEESGDEEEEDHDDSVYYLRIQQVGIASLANLAREESLLPSVMAVGGVKATFAAMNRYQDNANLQEKGLDAIGTFARVESGREMLAMKEYDAVKVIMDSMRRNPSDETIQRRACIALHRLAAGDSDYCSAIGDSGAIDIVLDGMRNLPNDAKTQKLGCAALKALARKADSNKTRIVAGGGMSVVLHAMARHEDDSGVQEEACRVFGYLSICHVLRKFSIARSGALERILGAMKRFPKTSGVQVAGCVALLNLTNKLQIAQMANHYGALQVVRGAKPHSRGHATTIIRRLRLARYAPIMFFS